MLYQHIRWIFQTMELLKLHENTSIFTKRAVSGKCYCNRALKIKMFQDTGVTVRNVTNLVAQCKHDGNTVKNIIGEGKS